MTVEEYKARMRNVEKTEARKGVVAHAVVTILVSALLAVINLSLTPEVIWFIFPMVGMSAGALLHYALAVVFLDKEIARRESMI
jgi:hypothetical protein